MVVLIPAWQPGNTMHGLLEKLLEQPYLAVIVVDDGSSLAAEPVFLAAAALERVHLLRHAVNLGKGRALKTGINYLLQALPTCTGVVTADADGQHTPQDILRVAGAMVTAGDRTVIGVRRFAADVPLRSRFGNILTRQVFRLITGARVSDTQTGLRAFPRALLPRLLKLEGERYEYEMTVLADVCLHHRRPLEIPIATVYIDSNRGSHFDPVRDSMRICFVLVRFCFSSILAAAIDLAGFSLVFALTANLPLSIAVGRLSSLVNYALNKRFVFHSRQTVAGTLWKYYVLVLAVAGMSYAIIWLLTRRALECLCRQSRRRCRPLAGELCRAAHVYLPQTRGNLNAQTTRTA
jgi:glycosyltransferase involved in cell wall biosynthesis